jgi:hypothetical protein
MRKTSIVIAILSLIFLPVLIEACHSKSDCDCCDQPITSKPYSMQDVYLTTTVNGMAAQYRVNPKQVRFGFEIDPKYLAFSRGYRPTMGTYADCAPPVPTSKEKFTSVKITSETAITTNNNDTYAAGSDLATHFLLTGFIKNDVMTGLTFSFTPAFGVKADQEHNFKFKFTVDDGREFELESGHFLLLKDQ